jgi:hypothetical protein
VELFKQLMISRTGDTTTTISNPTWLSNFKIHRELVNHYRCGYVFLAGDRALQGVCWRYPSGSKTSLFEQFKGTQFTLLLFDGLSQIAFGYAHLVNIASWSVPLKVMSGRYKYGVWSPESQSFFHSGLRTQHFLCNRGYSQMS